MGHELSVGVSSTTLVQKRKETFLSHRKLN